MSTDVLFEIHQSVATITLNRPDKHNAFDDTIIESLIACLGECRRTPDVRVLVLQAEGKSFSAGADLGWMKRMATLDYEDNLKDAKRLAQLMADLNALPIPTIAKIQGAAFGGAIGLIACCDIAVASVNAKFSLSEAKLGLAPATIGPYVVSALGPRRCRRLFITAEVFSADDALNWNLLHEVVEPNELSSHVESLVSKILANGPLACQAAKKLISNIENALDLSHSTSELIAQLRVSEEGQEGLTAFFEKRSPTWQH